MKLDLTNSFLRRIGHAALGTLTALALVSCGGGGGSPGAIPGVSTGPNVGAVSLLFSSSELKSAGAAGTEVTVTALVKNSNNVAVADIPVEFSATSGALGVVDAKTDKNGQAKASLGTAGDRTNRRITVSVKAGSQTATGTVDVVGTTVAVASPGAVSAGGSGDYTISVKDSSNAAVPNVPVSFTSQKGNPITVKTSNGGSATAPLTNAQGQVVLTVTATQAGNDALSVTSQGASASSAVNVNAAKIAVAITDSNNNDVSQASTTSSCLKIVSHYDVNGVGQSGTVNITTSRGVLYSDNACTSGLVSSAVPLSSGNSNAVFIKSDSAGIATVTATVPNGPSAQDDVEFVAPLTASATLTLQVDPAVIGANSGTGNSEKSTITAIVRDGTAKNNFVKDAVIEFSIVTDKSGGALSNPSVVKTLSNGAASVVYFAGTAATERDGVEIQARIQGTTTTAKQTLTVAKKSLFISAGTGNLIGTPSSSTYQQDYTVIVTDAAGNAVPNVTVTASVYPTHYAKGFYSYDTAGKHWVPTNVYICENEDRATRDGVLDAGEDDNLNGVLDPGLPVAITSSGTTDATGVAKVSLIYPRDRGNWIEAQVTIRGSASGSETVYQTPAYFLPILAADVGDQNTAPPGNVADISSLGFPAQTAVISPYGFRPCNQKN